MRQVLSWLVYARSTRDGFGIGLGGSRLYLRLRLRSRGRSGRLHRMPQVIKLDTAVVAVIQTSAQQTLHDARYALYDRIDLVRRDSSRHLVSMTPGTLDEGCWFQRKLPRQLRFHAAFTALENLFVYEPLVPPTMPPS
jgi:hypothetical protein